jgi:hypothetical protein
MLRRIDGARPDGDALRASFGSLSKAQTLYSFIDGSQVVDLIVCNFTISLQLPHILSGATTLLAHGRTRRMTRRQAQ